MATYLYPAMSNAHLNYLCNIAANSSGKQKIDCPTAISFNPKIFLLDGTSPTPMLFTPITTAPSDLSSRHQQIIDAFLNDGKNVA